MCGNTIHLANEGSVDVKRITTMAMIAGWFDLNSNKITAYQVSRGQQLLTNMLRQGDSFEIDLKSHLIPVGIDIPKDSAGGMTVYGFVVAYRRAADMKPFVMFLPFSVSKDTKTRATDIFMPLFPSFGSAEAGPANTSYSLVLEEAREELITLYKDKVAQIVVK
jgi:hypothetical protein